MKKYLLILILYIFILIPINTKATLCIAGNSLTDSIIVEGNKGGTLKYDASTKTITLNNYKSENEVCVKSGNLYVFYMFNEGDFTFKLIGNNSISYHTDEGDSVNYQIARSNNDITLIGEDNSSLNIDIKMKNINEPELATGKASAFLMQSITIKNLKLNIDIDNASQTSGIESYIYSKTPNNLIENSTINMNLKGTNKIVGINYQFNNNLTINNSTININVPIQSYNDATAIASSMLTVDNSNVNIYAPGEYSRGIYSLGMKIKDSNVKIVARQGITYHILEDAAKEYYSEVIKDNFYDGLMIDNSLVEVNVSHNAIVENKMIDSSHKNGLNPVIDKINYSNYKVYVGDGNQIEEWNGEDSLTNFKYVKIFNYKNEGELVPKDNINKNNNLEEIIELTSDEEELINLGFEIEIKATIEEINVNEEVKNIIEENIKSKETVAKYLDINLYKEAALNKTQLTELNNNIKIDIKLDDSLINKDKNTNRTFKVLRYHDGDTEEVNSTYNKNNNTITIETNKFSTYALIYADEVINPQTGDNLNQYILLALISSITLIATVITKRTIEI